MKKFNILYLGVGGGILYFLYKQKFLFGKSNSPEQEQITQIEKTLQLLKNKLGQGQESAIYENDWVLLKSGLDRATTSEGKKRSLVEIGKFKKKMLGRIQQIS